MASPYASIQLHAQGGGSILYCTNQLLPGIEGDLYGGDLNAPMGLISDPFAVRWDQGVSAEVFFSPNQVSSNPSTYVIMQTSFDSANWFDVAWCTFTGAAAINNLFLISSAAPGAVQSYNQTRLPGTAPSPANGSNSMGLGSRMRFVGKSTATTSGSASSGSSGVLFGMLVTVRYRLQPLR